MSVFSPHALSATHLKHTLIFHSLNSRKPQHKRDQSVFELAAFEPDKPVRSKPSRIVFRKATAQSETVSLARLLSASLFRSTTTLRSSLADALDA